MSKEDLARATLRTGELMASFGKWYVVAYVQNCMNESLNQIVADLMGQVEEKAKEIRTGRKMTVLPTEEKEKAAPVNEEFVAVQISGHHEKYDVDNSRYTAYNVCSVVVRPSGSVIRAYETRYRALRRQNEDLKKALKESAPELKKLKFPGKKLFGNKDPEFLASRTKELNEYFNACALDPTIANSHDFRVQVGLETDDRRELEKLIFVNAFNMTLTANNISCNEDPSDFEDEGTGLTVLMLDVVDREIVPSIREKIWAKVPPGSVRDSLLWNVRSAVNKAVGKATQAAWNQLREKFNDLKKKVLDTLEQQKDVINDMLKKVVNMVAPKIIDKLATVMSKKEEKKPEEDALLKVIIEPALSKVELGREIISATKENPKCLDVITALQRDLRERMKTRRRLETKLNYICDDFEDLPPLRYTMRGMVRCVMGVIDLWILVIKTLLEGVSPFFAAKDKIEAAVASSSDPAQIKDVVLGEVNALRTNLGGELRRIAISVAVQFDRERRDLSRDLRALSRGAAEGLAGNVTAVPEKMLDFLASFRRDLLSKLETEFSEVPANPQEAVTKLRLSFINVGQTTFDDVFFKDAWQALVVSVFDAARTTLVDQLGEPIKEIVGAVLESVTALIPDVVKNLGLDVNNIISQVVDKILFTVATKALVKVRAKLENYVFSEEP